MNDFQRLVEARLEATSVTVGGEEIRVKMVHVPALGGGAARNRDRAAGKGQEKWPSRPFPAGWYAQACGCAVYVYYYYY